MPDRRWDEYGRDMFWTDREFQHLYVRGEEKKHSDVRVTEWRCSCGAIRRESVSAAGFASTSHVRPDGRPGLTKERCRDADAREVHES